MLVLIQVVGTRNLSTLRSSAKTSATFAFNLKLNNAQETFSAEDLRTSQRRAEEETLECGGLTPLWIESLNFGDDAQSEQ